MEKELFSLVSGNPCRIYNCSKCCINTKMPLTKNDIARIEKQGFKKEFFVSRTKNGFKLKNIKGKCVFLFEKLCKVYNNRPEGCKVYPLIFDEQTESAILDNYCGYMDKFIVQKSDLKRLYQLLVHLHFL